MIVYAHLRHVAGIQWAQEIHEHEAPGSHVAGLDRQVSSSQFQKGKGKTSG